MELTVLGCHGGETSHHRNTAFLLDASVALDAGALTRTMALVEQATLKAVVVSHAHLDHVKDLASLADNRLQLGVSNLVVAGTRTTLHALSLHFFNGVLWPDFRKIKLPNGRPCVEFVELPMEKKTEIFGFSFFPISMNHTIDCVGFIISGSFGSFAYTGDTGPTDRFWQLINNEQKLRVVLAEVSLPNQESNLAKASGHHTPRSLFDDLRKCDRLSELDILLHHMKPAFQQGIEKECASIRGISLHIMRLGEKYHL